MGTVIKCLKEVTGKECLGTYRRCLDIERAGVIEYDDIERMFMKEQGETSRYAGPQSVCDAANSWCDREPAIKLFMDGSRRTYKIADLPISTQIYPVLAGQVGVGVCKREDRRVSPCDLELRTVLAFPDKLDVDGKTRKQHRAFCVDLMSKLNAGQSRVKIDDVLLYPTDAKGNFEDKGVARIQECMVEQEKSMVKSLVNRSFINDRAWLIKDGSLEYNRIYDEDDPFKFSRIRSNYKRVIGVSKSFNPDLAKLRGGRSAAKMIAQLEPFQRTPAAMYSTERVDGKFAVWYLRLRESRKGRGPFDGVVKVEKILVTDHETEYGLDSSEVDNISAWLMNERFPVCYGKDDRWANHLYPVFLTETYIKSKYLSTAHFINLF